MVRIHYLPPPAETARQLRICGCAGRFFWPCGVSSWVAVEPRVALSTDVQRTSSGAQCGRCNRRFPRTATDGSRVHGRATDGNPRPRTSHGRSLRAAVCGLRFAAERRCVFVGACLRSGTRSGASVRNLVALLASEFAMSTYGAVGHALRDDFRTRGLSERLINRGPACDGLGERCVAGWMADAGPMIPICEDQEPEGARACPGYAPGRRRGGDACRSRTDGRRRPGR